MEAVIFGIGSVVGLVVSVISIRNEPRRIFNGFVLETSVVLLVYTLLAATKRGQFGSELTRMILIIPYVIIFLMGIILLIDFVWVIKKEGKSVPNALPFVFGILALFVSYAGYKNITSGISGSYVYVVIMSILYNIVLYVPYMIGAFLIYSIVYLCLPKKSEVDYLIVLGCRIRSNGELTPLLRGRVNCAIKRYRQTGERAKFVVSGGQGEDEVTSEAIAMKKYLLTQGIPDDKIILEDKSVNTRENLLFSQQKIDEDHCGNNVLICTSNYHVLRAVILARALSVNVQGIGGHTAFYYLPVAFFREYIAVIFRYKLLIAVYIFIAILSGVLMV